MTKSVLLLTLLLSASAMAQGLGDAAAREREKRGEKKMAAPAKVFTDADLAKPEAPAEDATSAEAAPGAAEEGTAVSEDPSTPALSLDKEREERKLLEAEWRIRFANAREQVAVAEAACWQEVVRTQFYNGIPVQMKVKEFVESQELRRAKAALADLEEEFRRTGLPPGWAREN